MAAPVLGEPERLPLPLPLQRQIDAHQPFEIQSARLMPIEECFLYVGREEREPRQSPNIGRACAFCSPDLFYRPMRSRSRFPNQLMRAYECSDESSIRVSIPAAPRSALRH